MERKSYTSVVDNVLDVQCTLPIEIIPGHFLSRADDLMIDHIEEFYRGYGAAPFAPPRNCKFKNRPTNIVRTSSGTTWDYEPLPRDEWRYYVVEHEAEHDIVNWIPNTITKVSRLTDVELTFSMILSRNGGGSASEMPNIIDFPVPLEAERFDERRANQIKCLYERLMFAENHFPDIARSIQLHYDLRRVGAFSPLYYLGLFAIIESVLTHDQNADHDSLTHQLKRKFELLQSRIKPQIDYGIFATKPKARQSAVAQVWNELYSWRSAIAHGDAYTNGNTVIPNIGAAKEWLRTTTKALLRQALEEPQLFHDLKRV